MFESIFVLRILTGSIVDASSISAGLTLDMKCLVCLRGLHTGMLWTLSHVMDLHIQVPFRQLALQHDSVAFLVSVRWETLTLKCYQTFTTVCNTSINPIIEGQEGLHWRRFMNEEVASAKC